MEKLFYYSGSFVLSRLMLWAAYCNQNSSVQAAKHYSDKYKQCHYLFKCYQFISLKHKFLPMY